MLSPPLLTSDEDRYQLHYSRSQVRQLMPGIEVLVLAGVLADMTDRPGPDLATRNACRWWSTELSGLLSVASAATVAAISQQPASSTGRGPQRLRLAACHPTSRLVEGKLEGGGGAGSGSPTSPSLRPHHLALVAPSGQDLGGTIPGPVVDRGNHR